MNRELKGRRRQEETQEETQERNEQNRIEKRLRGRNLSASDYENELEAQRNRMSRRRRRGTVHKVALTNTIPELF